MSKPIFIFAAKNWKNILLVALVISLALTAVILLRKKDEKDIDDQIRKDLQRSNPQVDTFQIVSDASGIYQAFGLDSSWFNPSAWTEDEDAVIGILQRYNPSSFKILEDVYYEKYSRYLEPDIRNFFRESQLEQVAHLI